MFSAPSGEEKIASTRPQTFFLKIGPLRKTRCFALMNAPLLAGSFKIQGAS
jgi:hypothetical protein